MRTEMYPALARACAVVALLALAPAGPAAARQDAASPAPVAQPPRPTPPSVPAELMDYLEGRWSGSGRFIRTGAPVQSTFSFERIVGGEALQVRHAEAAPNTFAYAGLLTMDTVAGELVLLLASNNRGGGRLFRSAGWIDDRLAFEAAPELQAWFARERITFIRVDGDSFRATYEMSRDGGQTWRTGDEQLFTRDGG